MSTRWVARLYCYGDFPGCESRVWAFNARNMDEARSQYPKWINLGDDTDFCPNCIKQIAPHALVAEARRLA